MSWDVCQGMIFDKIVVARERIESDDAYEVIDELSTFAQKAQEIGGLRTDEFRAEILWNSQLTRYCSQVGQNGHYLYVGNSGWKIGNVEACRHALAACRLEALADIYDALAALVDRIGFDPDTWNENYDAVRRDQQRFGPFQALDSRYFDLDEAAILGARVAWIRALSNLIVVPETEVDAMIASLAAANPMRASRLAELAGERDKAQSQRRAVERSRLATTEGVRHANAVLKTLRRMFKGDPKEVLPGYWDLGDGMGWPLDAPGEQEWSLLILATRGEAALLQRGNVINGPKKMPAAAAAYFAANG